MNFVEKIDQDIKTAMKSRDQVSLRAIRAIKNAILIAKTDGSGQEVDEDMILRMLQKLIKQRQESLDIYTKQGRHDLAQSETEEIEVIRRYLPAQLTDDELDIALKKIIKDLGATSKKDMGKVMGKANQVLKGKADGKRIAQKVQEILA